MGPTRPGLVRRFWRDGAPWVAGDETDVAGRATDQAQHEGGIDQVRGHAAEVRAMTAVRVVLRAGCQAGPHGILVDIPHEGEEVLVRPAQERPVSTLEHVAHLGVAPVEAL